MKLQHDIAAVLAVHDAYNAFRRLPLLGTLPGPARRALFALWGILRAARGRRRRGGL